MVFLTIACQSLGVIGGDSITRIAYYFSIYLTLYIPSLISKLNNKNRLLLSIMFTAIFIAFFIMIVQKNIIMLYLIISFGNYSFDVLANLLNGVFLLKRSSEHWYVFF